MGRIIFLTGILLLFSPTAIQAQTKSYDIRVSATVLPSPKWINLLHKHSTISNLTLPFVNLNIYQLHLSDGNINIRNQQVHLLIHNQIIRTQLTDSLGNVTFVVSNKTRFQPQFIYTVSGISIPLSPS